MTFRRFRRPLLVLAVLLATLVAVDWALNRFALQDGVFMGRPVPPYANAGDPRFAHWIRRLEESLARGDSAPGTSRYDRELGWSRRPNSQPDADHSSNSIGARGQREYAPQPPDGVLRVVACGESFTYGEEVSDVECWCARIEAADERIEVVNFGVDGYGTDQALLSFRRDGASLEPQLVIVGVMVENIGRNVNRQPRLWNPWIKVHLAKPRFVLTGGQLELVPPSFADQRDFVSALTDGSFSERLREHEVWQEPPADNWLWHSALVRIARGYLSSRLRTPQRLWRDEQGESFRVLVALLEAFRRDVMAAGAREFLVVIFPMKGDLQRVLDGGDRYWRGLERELDARGISWIDTTETLAREAGERGAAGLFRRAHFDPRGNQIVADLLLDWIRERFPVGASGY